MTSKLTPLKPFTNLSPLIIDGFTKYVPEGRVTAFTFSDVTAQQRLNDFAEELLGAMSKRFLPVYRMADGEFAFCLGGFLPHWNPKTRRPYIKSWLKYRLYQFQQLVGLKQGFETSWGEFYPDNELSRLQAKLAGDIRFISEHGYIAAHFGETPNCFSCQFFEPVLQFFETNNIELKYNNYFPFFLVYALLNGPWRARIFNGKKILVVTGLNPDREDRIRKGLKARKVASVNFLQIGSRGSMDASVDLSNVDQPDLVLVAAGVGSASVLRQLKPLETVCIDCGICIEVIADPLERHQRIFLCRDDEWDSIDF